MKNKTDTYKALLSIIFWALGHTVAAQYNFSIKNFNTENGLTQNTITGMCIDYDGYLWLGTQNGVVRYDGKDFRTFLFDTKNTNAANNSVQTITSIAAQKKTLIRTRSGMVFAIIKGKPVLYSDSLKNITYYYEMNGAFPSLALFNKFNLLTWRLVYEQQWDGSKTFIVPVNNTDFIVNSEDKKIVFYYKNGAKAKIIPIEGEFNSFFISGQCIFLKNNQGNLYRYDSSLYQFKKIAVNWSGIKSGATNGNDKEGVFYTDWFSGNTWCLANSTFYLTAFDPIRDVINFSPHFTVKDEKHIWKDIVYDSLNGTVFLSTLNEGLFQLKLKRIQTINLNDKLSKNQDPSGAINYAVLKTSDSTVVTTKGFQLSNNDGYTHIKKLGNLDGNRESIAQLPNGNILCIYQTGLFYYQPSDGYLLKHAYNDSFNSFNKSSVTMIYPEGDSVWVGTNTGIYCLTQKTITTVFKRKADDFSIYFGLHLFQRISNTSAYISNPLGLYILKTSPPFSIDTIYKMNGKHVRCITPYKDVAIFSVYKNGLYVLKKDSLYKVPTNQTELSVCHSTYIDSNGYIWITTDKGLFKSTAASIVESVINPNAVPFFLYYGKNEGIENTEFNGGGMPSFAVLKNEQLFYPSMGGIVTFNPQNLEDKILNAPVAIEKVMVDNNEIKNYSDTIQLQRNFKYVTINLSAANFGDAANLWIQYNLDDTEWKTIPVGEKLQIILVDIASGQHQLTIRRRTGFASNNYAYTMLTIVKEKQWYERLWFYPAVLVVVAFIIWLLLRLNAQSIKRKRDLLQKKVNEQTEELSKTVELKDMLISIISHDMIAPLRHVSLVANVLGRGLEKDPEKVTSGLNDIKLTADRILSGSVSIINWMKYNNKRVNLEKKQVELYSFIEETLAIYMPIATNKNIGLVNDVSPFILATVDYNIFTTIVGNIISNAIKYSASGNVTIFATNESNNETTLIISDTGQGMTTEILTTTQEVLKGNLQALKSTSKISTGLGYIIIYELAKIHNITITVESELGKGTKVLLIFANS